MSEVSSELLDQITNLQISDEKLFAHPLVQELLKQVAMPRTRDYFEWTAPLELKDEGERIIAGYASVELIDKQGDMIPLDVLRKAWDKFISNPDFMTSQLLHSNVPVGKFLLEHPKVPKKAGVDDKGLFVICKIRDDIKKGDETWDMIKTNQLRAFSIGGEALKRSFICDGRCYKRIDELELHEISIVGQPANQGSFFTIIKSLNKPLKLEEVLKTLPEGMILIKDFVCMVGSVAEKGTSEHDFDLLVKHPLEENSFLRRAVLVRLQKEFPDVSVGRGGQVDVFFGDPEGPHDSFIPMYDLVLLKRNPIETIPMKLEKCPSCILKAAGGNKQRFMEQFKLEEAQHNLVHAILGDKMYNLLEAEKSGIFKSILKSLIDAHEDLTKTEQLHVQREILTNLKQCSEDVNKVWSDEAREAAAEARRAGGSASWSKAERAKVSENISYESMEHPDSEAMQPFADNNVDPSKVSDKLSAGKPLSAKEEAAVSEFKDRFEPPE
jgi:HK97 family phage prohead protease